MTATHQVKPWDFSHVLDLVHSLATKPETIDAPHSSPKSLAHSTPAADDETSLSYNKDVAGHNTSDASQSLGDFGKLWQFLGSPPVDSPSPQPVAQNEAAPTDVAAFHYSTNYTSDGAVETVVSSKQKSRAKQRGQITPIPDVSSADDPDGDTLSDGSAVPDTPTLTKSQRKKRNRKERRAKEAALEAERAGKASAVVSESEANHVARKTPAKKASVHNVSTPPPPSTRYNLRPRDASGRVSSAAEPHTLPKAVRFAVDRLEAAKKQVHENDLAVETNKAVSSHATPLRPTTNGAHDVSDSQSRQTHSSKSTYTGGATHFLPSSVKPTPPAVEQNGSQRASFNPVMSENAKRSNAIAPIVARSGEDRHWALLIKLISDFYEDRRHLISPMNLTTHNNDSKGIHVFVDASNIFIGFNEQLKRSRGIPPTMQIPAVGLSFDALALLMERRRPVAKRVLVGSTPHLPAFDKAKAVGYECNILEKVYKARELTERQIYFKELDYNVRNRPAKAPPANNVATIHGGGSGSGSGSETNAPQYAPPRMIEQGVDEILHLKILESVVDAEAPGTMVLATGDAARAEYSEGFMAMTERALKKGWTVELVSWSANISKMYTQRAWTLAWGERFRIVTLDDYAEELLDM